MQRHTLKPILVFKDFNLPSELWVNKSVNIYINHKGEIYCDYFVIKDFTRTENFKQKYWFIKRYLDKKRKAYDVTGIYNITIGDLRQIMWSKDIKSISRNRIEGIVHNENQIANIKDDTIQRLKKYLEKKLSEKRNG